MIVGIERLLILPSPHVTTILAKNVRYHVGMDFCSAGLAKIPNTTRCSQTRERTTCRRNDRLRHATRRKSLSLRAVDQLIHRSTSPNAL
jgi:hypothetical protein